jgi:hypothetical protein
MIVPPIGAYTYRALPLASTLRALELLSYNTETARVHARDAVRLGHDGFVPLASGHELSYEPDYHYWLLIHNA